MSLVDHLLPDPAGTYFPFTVGMLFALTVLALDGYMPWEIVFRTIGYVIAAHILIAFAVWLIVFVVDSLGRVKKK